MTAAGSATAITTFLRLRPTKAGTGYFHVDPSEPSRVGVEVPPEQAAGLVVNHKRTNWRFAFDGVIDAHAAMFGADLPPDVRRLRADALARAGDIPAALQEADRLAGSGEPADRLFRAELISSTGATRSTPGATTTHWNPIERSRSASTRWNCEARRRTTLWHWRTSSRPSGVV